MLLSGFVCLLFVQVAYGWRDFVRPKPTTTTTEELHPWHRTIYGTVKEIVTPTVIAGVTFSAKPDPTPDPLKPWVSLKKDGLPQTIKPEVKKGRTVKGPPDYSTYFKAVSTRTYSYEELQAHNMDPNEKHEEEVFTDEDDTYSSLNPILRCTPDRYSNKGVAKDISSQPFCTPHENVDWYAGRTYFITWYTHFFWDKARDAPAEQARVMLYYVKKGQKMHKREPNKPFFRGQWVKNIDGLFAIEIDEDWLQGQSVRRLMLAVQPSTIPDEEFDPLEHGILVRLALPNKVFKANKQDLKLLDSGMDDESWYYLLLTLPTVVVFVAAFVYFFLQWNRRYTDFSDISRAAIAKKHRIIGKFKDMPRFRNMRNHRYDELPQHNKSSKQS
ncbi:AaceriADR134Cp [[Ashbya] aceris (nom. inval.)]|nr:AaceriADR134Cp [[Ashbya] aceris (nom. inval.)]